MSDETTTSPESNSGGMRRKLLFGILAILLVALAYDYTVARPNVETAYNKIVDRSTEVNADSTKVFTNLDVRSLIGKDPSRTFQDANGDTVEVFSWRSGLPIKTHDLFAVYKPNAGNLMFYRHAKFKYETSGDVSKFSVPMVIDSGPGTANDGGYGEEGPGDEEGGGGGPGAGGPGGGGGPGGSGGRGGFDPEARFTEQDADGDGVWKGDEIPQRARENMADIDTDGDGAVSKDEWMARVEAMRAQFGGGGGRGGGEEGRPRARQRPELEDESADEESAQGATSDEQAADAAEEKPAEEKTGNDSADSSEDEN